MKLKHLALLLVVPLTLAGCSSDPEPTPDAPTPDSTVLTGPPTEETEAGNRTDAPTLDTSPTPLPMEGTPVESMNTDEEWDDWTTDQPLPDSMPEGSLAQLIRMDFKDPQAIRVQVRLALPESVLNASTEGEVSFCDENSGRKEVVGFGDHWSAELSKKDGYAICDTTGTFSLDEWGADAMLPAPELVDGKWRVNFQRAFMPEATVALYRLRMEFGGPVVEASEGGRVEGNTVTWNGPSDISATAESGR